MSEENSIWSSSAKERPELDLLNLFSEAARSGMAAGLALGALSLIAAIGAKRFVDRTDTTSEPTASRNIRREAAAQRKALNASDRVPRGTSAGGQFAPHQRADAEIGL